MRLPNASPRPTTTDHLSVDSGFRLGAPSRRLCVFVAVWTLVVLERASRPTGLGFFTGVFLLTLIALPTVVALCVTRIPKRKSPQGTLPKESTGIRSAFLLLCLAVWCIAPTTDAFLRLRFHFSKPAFQQAAQAFLAGEKGAADRRWIGLYRVDDISSEDPGKVQFTTGRNFDRSGFEYDGKNPPAAGTTRVQLAPFWYSVEW
jgi:hypothetical protein